MKELILLIKILWTQPLSSVSIWSFAKYLTAFRSRRVFRSLSNIYNETFFPKIINGSIVDARMSFKYASDLLSKNYWQYRFIQNHSRLFLAKDFSKFSNNFNLLCKGVSQILLPWILEDCISWKTYHCVNSVQIWSFFWSEFLFLVRRGNTD